MKVLSIASFTDSLKSQIRTSFLLKYLYEHHQVTLVTQQGTKTTTQVLPSLRQWVSDVVIFPVVEASPPSESLFNKAKQLGVFAQQGTPPEILAAYSPEMQTWIDRAIDTHSFDILTCEGSLSEIYVRPQWQAFFPSVINVHRSRYGECKHQLDSKTEKKLHHQLNLSLLKRYEAQYIAKFSAIVTPTPEERRFLKTLNPQASITVIPNGLDLSRYPKRPANRGGQRIVFIGAMNKPANIEAAQFFALEVFPEILKRYPEATLELVGIRPVPEVLALGNINQITVTGQVSSIVDYLHWATVCVIPIRKSVGTKIRTLEAMATGVPVVASDYGLEGLAVDGAGVSLRAMRANSVDEYVYAIGRLFETPKLREKLSNNSRAFIKNEYTWERMGQRYEELLLEVVRKP